MVVSDMQTDLLLELQGVVHHFHCLQGTDHQAVGFLIVMIGQGCKQLLEGIPEAPDFLFRNMAVSF